MRYWQSSEAFIIISRLKIIVSEPLYDKAWILVNQKIKEGDEPKEIYCLIFNEIGKYKNILETKDIDFKTKKERFVDTEILMFDVEPVEV